MQERVGHQSPPTTVSIWPWVNKNELVVQPRGNLVQLVHAVGQPERCVAETFTQGDADFTRGNSNVLAGSTIFSRPRPRLIEHSAVQFFGEFRCENCLSPPPTAGHRPRIRTSDVELLPRIEFAERGDVRGCESVGLVGVQRSGTRRTCVPNRGASNGHAYLPGRRFAAFASSAVISKSHSRRGLSASAAARSATCASRSAGLTA